MSVDSLSPEIRTFINEHIDSVVQLEVLLLLHANPTREWSSAEIGKELRIDPAWAEDQMGQLCARGVLSCTEPPNRVYRYRPSRGEVDRAVGELAQAYADRRVSVITQIFSKPMDKIRTFADAFRLRKDQSDG